MMNENQLSDLQDKLSQELRRGVLVLAVLSQLEEEKYGYALINRLGAKGLDIDQGTLYPLLRRLEDQGLLESEWNTEGSRPRRYYRRSAAGSKLYNRLSGDWREIIDVMNGLLTRQPKENKK